MWIRYFVTFIDAIMVMLTFFFSRGLNWEKEKNSIIGSWIMIFIYVLNGILLWI